MSDYHVVCLLDYALKRTACQAGWQGMIFVVDKDRLIGAYHPVRIEWCMDGLFDVCAIEVGLIEADREIESRVWKSKHVPRDRTQLSHLVYVEAWIDLQDGGEDIVKDITTMN